MKNISGYKTVNSIHEQIVQKSVLTYTKCKKGALWTMGLWVVLYFLTPFLIFSKLSTITMYNIYGFKIL